MNYFLIVLISAYAAFNLFLGTVGKFIIAYTSDKSYPSFTKLSMSTPLLFYNLAKERGRTNTLGLVLIFIGDILLIPGFILLFVMCYIVFDLFVVICRKDEE